MAGFRWFQVVSGSFWVVSGGFRWFQVVPCFSKYDTFFEKLGISVQALETMNKLKELNGYFRLTLDKLLGIRADLVRLDDNWQEWDFAN